MCVNFIIIHFLFINYRFSNLCWWIAWISEKWRFFSRL